MPRQRFENLPIEKKERIKKEILRQLSQTTFDNFSIKKMMSELNLDRRSFRFYFYGLDDMVEVVLKDYWDKERELYKKLFIQEDKLLLKNIVTLVSELVAYAENQDYVLVLKNIFYSLKMSVKNSFETISRDIKKIAIDLFPKVLKLIGERKIQDKKVFENYYENIISMCVLLYRNTIVSIFCNFDNKEMFFDFFKKNLEIIKIGAMQKLCEITE